MIETLVRINIPSTQDYELLPYEQGLYFVKLTKPGEGYGPYYSQWVSSGINERTLTVGSVAIDVDFYTNRATLAGCISDDKSFFYDNGNQTLYIHYEFDKIPENTQLSIGIQGGFSFIGTKESIYIGNVLYQPLVRSTPTIKNKVDKFQAGKMRFTDQKIVINNGDGQLDDFIQNPVPGAEASIVLYDTEEDTELVYLTGLVSSDSSTYDDFTFKIIDKRRRENIKIPNTLFNATTYADIESKYVNKLIPEGYGDVIRIPCYPVNGKVGSGNIKFKYATDATTLTSVEVEEDGVWDDTVTPLNSDPSTGYFELSYAEATNASGGILPCVCTARLRDYDNPGDIIKDMNDRYNSVPYDATGYDLTEWPIESALLADVSLYMAKSQEFFKYIETLQNGSDYWFIYYINGEGKRILRVNDPDRTLARAITYAEIKNDMKPVTRDFSEFSSSVAITYSEDVEAKASERVINDDYEESVLGKYRFVQDSEFASLLTAEVDADRKAAIIAEDQSEARPVATVVLHAKSLTGLDLQLYDIITVDLSRPDTTYFKTAPDTIEADYTGSDTITADYTDSDSIYANNGEIIDMGDGREYWGTIRGQLIGIEFNPASLDYTLTVRERPESEVV